MSASAESQAFEAFSQKRRAVADLLRGLRGTADKIGARTLASRLGRELVDKLDEDRFNLVVVGEFNHGKTSLVNALLGLSAAGGAAEQAPTPAAGDARVLPVGVTPTTAVIHHVSWAETPKAVVVHVDGRREDVPFDALARYCAANEADKTRDDIGYIDVGYPAEILRDRIVLVDTPGVNDLCLQRADITYKYIPQSDAVLFVIDAGQPLKESERLFLKDKLIGQSRDKIIFVVTKVDIWSEAEKTEALDYIASELKKLVTAPVVFPVSPLRVQQGSGDASGMNELVRHLRRFLAEERGRILLDNALGEGLEACRVLTRGIDARRRAARMTADELARRIERIEGDLAGQRTSLEERRAAVRESVAAIRAWVRRDLDRFVDDVIRQLPELIDKASVEDLKKHLSGFLETTFRQWAEAECDEVARALEELGERTVALMREDAHEAAKRLGELAGAEVTTPSINVDTFAYDVGVFALFTAGMGMLFTNLLLGGLLTLAAPVLAMYLKDRVEVQTRVKAKELCGTALREAAARVAPKLDEMIEGFKERLDTWLVAAGRELHQELIDVLGAMRNERADVEPDAERTAKNCDELDAELASAREVLTSTRTGLWQPAVPAAAGAEAQASS